MHKNQLKMDQKTNKPPETLNILEENIEKIFQGIDTGKGFLMRIPIAQNITARISK